mmetsp:Transcript_51100/g.59694  ORF Transcript_51100/g.59694 Transcript_51100/m.59694 type:complete len:116 (-) Transcript_51100:1357-1704(-)
MFAFLAKKIAIPNQSQLNSLSWSGDQVNITFNQSFLVRVRFVYIQKKGFGRVETTKTYNRIETFTYICQFCAGMASMWWTNGTAKNPEARSISINRRISSKGSSSSIEHIYKPNS